MNGSIKIGYTGKKPELKEEIYHEPQFDFCFSQATTDQLIINSYCINAYIKG